MSVPTPSSPQRPVRRKGAGANAARRRGEARPAIVERARALFGENGYDGTNMRDIATAAQVSEGLLYRYFPSKQTLFLEAAVEPYQGFVQQFLEGWERLDARLSNEEMVARFVAALYDFIRENQDLLFALIAANRFNAHDPGEAGLLSQGVKRLADYAMREAGDRGFGHVDMEMAVASTIAMVFSMAMLDDLLFTPGAQHPAKERIVEQMTRYATAGIQQSGERSE
jgi:AcrR family transcriptional regulator